MKIDFVILHYKNIECTKDCVNSILNLPMENIGSIIVVDNGSRNNTGQALAEQYKSFNKVKVILLEENIGFAKGNNEGYSYAKKNDNPDYIIFANSDVCFQQKNILSEINNIYQTKNFYVLGPDIVNLSYEHQSPLRRNSLSYNEVCKHVRNKKILYCSLILEKKVPIFKYFNLPKSIYNYKGKKRKQITTDGNECTNCVLHGACIIVSQRFISENDSVFYFNTFLYGEEDILAYVCKEKNYLTIFSKNIQVIHKEEGSTKELFDYDIDKKIFQIKNEIASLDILKNEMKKRI